VTFGHQQYRGHFATIVRVVLDVPQFISASKEINERAAEYWPLVMDVARRNNVKRIMRCGQIMGRSDTDEMNAAQIFYPCMQCADIFFLKARPLTSSTSRVFRGRYRHCITIACLASPLHVGRVG